MAPSVGGSWLATNRLACRLPHIANRSDEQRARTSAAPFLACGYSLACGPASHVPCSVPRALPPNSPSTLHAHCGLTSCISHPFSAQPSFGYTPSLSDLTSWPRHQRLSQPWCLRSVWILMLDALGGRRRANANATPASCAALPTRWAPAEPLVVTARCVERPRLPLRRPDSVLCNACCCSVSGTGVSAHCHRRSPHGWMAACDGGHRA